MKTPYAGILLLLSGFWLTGCTTASHHYSGPAFERLTAFDGKCLLIQDKLLDVRSGKVVREFSAKNSDTNSDRPKYLGPYVAANALSADGKLAAIARANVIGPEMVGPGPVELWDIGTGCKVLSFQPDEVFPYDVQFSPDGKRILTLLDTQHNTNTLQLRDVRTGRLLQSWSNFWMSSPTPALDASFSPNGRCVMSLSYEQITVWDATSGEQVLALKKPDTRGFYASTQFSPDGKRILTEFLAVAPKNEQAILTVWDAKTGEPMVTMTDDLGEGSSTFALFTPDGRKIISGSTNGTAVVRDASTGKELRRLQGAAGSYFQTVDKILFSRDGKRVLTGWNRNSPQEGVTPFTALWDMDTSTLIKQWDGALGTVVSFSSRDDTFITIKNNQPCKLVDGLTGKVIREYQE